MCISIFGVKKPGSGYGYGNTWIYTSVVDPKKLLSDPNPHIRNTVLIYGYGRPINYGSGRIQILPRNLCRLLTVPEGPTIFGSKSTTLPQKGKVLL
jgi:hypothetical protein